MHVADSAKYDFILIIFFLFSFFFFFGTFRGLRGGVSGLCRFFRKISEAGDFFFFIGCISYALRDARKEDNGVGVRGFDSHPRLFFFFKVRLVQSGQISLVAPRRLCCLLSPRFPMLIFGYRGVSRP